ncbi:hypothetical protein TWF694_004756 [Orbilia ellipsospora]|uniref:Uncharacterized protein n=1 Tax=Orbilia ellipsospora TaxID=2528407 RepID=A0AAV9WW39_9PEZI
MNAQVVRSALQSATMVSAKRASSPMRAVSPIRQYSTAPSKTVTLFGTEYSKRKVYTIGGLILLADLAIFDYYYFFSGKK